MSRITCASRCIAHVNRLDTIKEKGIDFVKDLGVKNVEDLLTIIEWNEANVRCKALLLCERS